MRSSILLLLVAVAWPCEAWACRCIPPGPRVAYKRASAVAMVRIVKVVPQGDIGDRAEGEVLRSWKSNLPRSITITGGGTDCGYPLESDSTYLLYLGRGEKGDYWTSRCVGSRSETQSAPYVKWLDEHGRRSEVTPEQPAPQ